MTAWFARPVLHVTDVDALIRFYVDRLGFSSPWLRRSVPFPNRCQHANRYAVLVHVNAATAAVVLFHNVLFDRRAKDAWDDEQTFLHVFIRR